MVSALPWASCSCFVVHTDCSTEQRCGSCANLRPIIHCKPQVWVDNNNVLVGTKCNNLLLLDVLTGRHRHVQLPAKPAVRLGPDLMFNPDGHCGMHAMDVSPDGRHIVTGGRAAEDAVVLRREGCTPVQTFSVRAAAAIVQVELHSSCMGHNTADVHACSRARPCAAVACMHEHASWLMMHAACMHA